MGAQDDRLGNKERILHVAGGVVGGNVQGFEVVVVFFNLGPLDDVEPHPRKDVADLPINLGNRVHRAAGLRAPGQGDVDRRGCALAGGGEGLHGCGYVGCQTLLDGVGALAGGRTLLGRKAGDGAQELGENPLAAEILDAQCLEFLGVPGGCFQLPPRLRLNLVQLIFHSAP